MILSAMAMCLATNIFFEARGEDLMGKLAIAEVTINRVASDKYPDNVCDVVWQRKQFSWTHDGKHDDPSRFTSKTDKEAWRDSQVMAHMVMSGELPLAHTGITMYHAEYVEPYWVEHYNYSGQIGKHLFYK
jgi:spore germination cell wall hydrolase CwlJ-like protein